MAGSYISKTAFIKFEQCEKSFFLYKNHYYLRDKPDVDKQLTFKRGHDIGFLARELFPGGIDVSENNSKENAIALTLKFIEEKAPVIYEATFVYNGVLVMVDILVLGKDGYEAYEVKSSIKISETYIKDACLQFYVLSNCLKNFRDFYLVTVNSEYVLKDELDIKQFFKRRSILKDALKNIQYMQERINHAKLVDERQSIPNIEIGPHCFSPYQCDFFNTCWKGKITENSIFNLGKVNKEELFNWYHNGVYEITEINNEKNLSLPLQQQILAWKQKKPIINKEIIQHYFSKLKTPYAAFDLEVWGAAVPTINGTKPFQKIPFLFTLKSNDYKDDVFMEFNTDDRKNFALALIEKTKNYNSLLVYDKSLESSVINELALLIPELKEQLINITKKFFDISEIIQKQYYFHHLFNGNFSLKAVSKVVLEENVFQSEQISTGLEAMNAYVTYKLEKNEIERQIIKDNLINYCLADTLATFLLAEKLMQLSKVE